MLYYIKKPTLIGISSCKNKNYEFIGIGRECISWVYVYKLFIRLVHNCHNILALKLFKANTCEINRHYDTQN